MQTVSDIRKRLSEASAEEYAVLERSLCADTRKGVQNALAVAKRRLAAEQAERERVSQLYSYQEQITNGAVTVGLDEVGRGRSLNGRRGGASQGCPSDRRAQRFETGA